MWNMVTSVEPYAIEPYGTEINCHTVSSWTTIMKQLFVKYSQRCTFLVTELLILPVIVDTGIDSDNKSMTEHICTLFPVCILPTDDRHDLICLLTEQQLLAQLNYVHDTLHVMMTNMVS